VWRWGDNSGPLFIIRGEPWTRKPECTLPPEAKQVRSSTVCCFQRSKAFSFYHLHSTVQYVHSSLLLTFLLSQGFLSMCLWTPLAPGDVSIGSATSLHKLTRLHRSRVFLTGWDYVSELLPLTDTLFIPQMIWVWGATVEWYWQGKTKELEEKPVPVLLCLPQIPHELTRERTRASAVRGRRLTAWAMARL
jgi:hypothetical protein